MVTFITIIKDIYLKIIMTSQKYEMVFDGRLKYVSKNVIFKTPVTLELLHIRLEDPLGNLSIISLIAYSIFFYSLYLL